MAIGIGVLLRLTLLGAQPLWRDEAFNAIAVREPLGAMLKTIGNDSAPPLIYMLQHLISQMWFSSTSIRITSALAGIAAIPLAYVIGQRIGARRAALWSAYTMAIFPSAVMASRDARMYSVAMTLSLAAVLTLWRFTERRTFGRWLAFTATCIACVYTDYFTIFGICGALAAALFWLRPGLRCVLVAAGGVAFAVATLAPWMLFAQGQLAHANQAFWVLPLDFFTLGGVVMQLFSGPPTDDGVPFLALQRMVQISALAGGLVAFLSLFRFKKQWRGSQRGPLAYVVGSGLIAIGGLIIASFWHPLVEARYASAMWGTLICATGVGLSLIRWRAVQVAAVASLVICTAVIATFLRYPDTPTLLTRLPLLGPHDLVESSPSAYLLIQYYGDPNVISHTKIVASDVPWYFGTAVFRPGVVVPDLPPDVAANRGRIYYIDVPDFYGAVLPDNYKNTNGQACFSTLCITEYRRS